MAASDVPVLIVGAGPTGMMLSLWLQKFSVRHRIVDAASSSGQTSRAVVMHARPLESYRQLGLADAMIAKGTKIEKFLVYHGSSPKGEIPAGESGRGLSKYPFVLSITQDEHEALQESTLAERGITVERGVEFVSATTDSPDHVKVTLRSQNKEEHITAGYVVGCDGAHSKVRHSAGIDMLGGTYDRAFFVADVLHTDQPNAQGQMNLCLSHEDFCMVIPLPHQQGRARVVGFVPRDVEAARPDGVTFEDVRPALARNAKHVQVEKVNWFSRYKVHHRVAGRFRSGRVFLCGDAAHIHSPVGGQGMNTGLGDATNLAWKLAAALGGRGTVADNNPLLDSYTSEREPFAHQLVDTTDAMFTLLTGDSLLSLFLRNIFIPYLAPLTIRLFGLGPAMYKRISQLEIEYRSSAVSVDEGPAQRKAAKAGDRLPWVESIVTGEDGYKNNDNSPDSTDDDHDSNANATKVTTDNFAALETATWQAHVYGKAPAWAGSKLADKGLALHVFQWDRSIASKGLRQDVLYIIRPDGHIGLVLAGADQAAGEKMLDAYTATWGIGKTL